MLVYETLKRLDLVSEERLKLFYPHVRDDENISVLRDNDTEVIILSEISAPTIEYYQEKGEDGKLEVGGQKLSLSQLQDNARRRDQFKGSISGKVWLDFGCGLGGVLDEMAPLAKTAIGLEPNLARAAHCKNNGHQLVDNLNSCQSDYFDVITLFHVFEHLVDIEKELLEIRRLLKDGGELILEIPHARDFLFTSLDCEAFKAFTFWSEHLVLHTKDSIRRVLENSGFQDIDVTGYQRYPLANHLYWLSHGKPGGHAQLSFLQDDELDKSYGEKLAEIDQTDSLIVRAKK